MKHFKIFASIAAAFFLPLFVFFQVASAHEFKTGTNVTYTTGSQINQTIFAAGNTVDINSEVFGDVFCAGQTVSISGTVHGDIICAAQTLNITGKVDGDVRLAGQTITLGAEVGRNATLAAQSITVNSTTKVGGDMTLGSTNATINGSIGRDLALGNASATIAGTVGRDVKGTVEDLELTSSARINGNVDYTSDKDVRRADGAVVQGRVTRSDMPRKDAPSKNGAIFGFSIGWFLYWFMAMLLTALAIALLFPRMLKVTSDKALPRPWKALLVGFLANLVIPVIFLILLLTVVGIPLAFVVLLAWLVIIFLSGPIFAFYLGRLIMKDSRSVLMIMFIGASLLLVLYFIPIIGFLALLAAMWVGAGMILMSLFSYTPKPAYTLVESPQKS